MVKKKTTEKSPEKIPLLPPVRPSASPPAKLPWWISKCILCNKLISLVILILLGMTSFYFNLKLRAISQEMNAEKVHIKELNDVVESQAAIIVRFNSSTTNAELLNKVNALQENLELTESNMDTRLRETQTYIQERLNKTLQELDGIVLDAQAEIQSEVNKVHLDVEDYVRTTQDQFSTENSFMIYQLAGTFTLIGCLISMWHMTDHLRHFNQPSVQRKILAILWMCPIYSITSWLSLVFISLEGYLGIIKDFYEAYVIYQFLSFLIAVLGKGDRNAVVDLLANHADHLSNPFRLFGICLPSQQFDSNRHKANAVLLQCQLFALQFVLLRPLTAISMFVFDKLEYYGGGTSKNDVRAPQLYISIVQNISVFVAFSGLLKFYHAVQDDLAWCRPWPKFLCIKGVVFMTFWQGLVIAILANTTQNFSDERKGNADEWAARAQSFLICLEMLLFSIAHFYCFPTMEWEDGYRPVENKDSRFGDNIALRDFFSDLKLVLGSKSRKSIKKSQSLNSCPTSINSDFDDGNGKASQAQDEDNAHPDEISIDDLENSLHNEDIPPEVREATKRVLTSKFIRNLSETNDDDEDQGDEETESGVLHPATTGSSFNAADDSDDEPGERTGLLAKSSTFGDYGDAKRKEETILRRSLFTSISNMSDRNHFVEDV